MLRVEVERPDGSVVLGDGSFLPGSDSAMTDVSGAFVYDYILNGIEGLYTVRVYDEGGAMLASVTFTDDRVIRWAKLEGETSVTVTPGETVRASLNVRTRGEWIERQLEVDKVPG